MKTFVALFAGLFLFAAVGCNAAVPSVDVGNKICPVSNEEVGKMGDVIKHEYNGKIYNLCCKMCKKDFDKNPEEYIKKLEAENHSAGEESHEGHQH